MIKEKNLTIKQRILALENELVPLVKKKFSKNAVTLLASGGCAGFDALLGWSDYDLIVIVNDREKAPTINVSSLEKKYGIKPIQIATKSWRSFIARTKGNQNTDRFVNTLWLIGMRTRCRVLTGKELIPLIPPVKELLMRDLGCELRANYLHITSTNLDWNIATSKNPKKWINCILNLSLHLLLAKGIVVHKNKITQALKKHYPDFTGTKIINEALKIRATGKIPKINSPEGRRAKKLLLDFLKIYRDYLFREIPAKK